MLQPTARIFREPHFLRRLLRSDERSARLSRGKATPLIKERDVRSWLRHGSKARNRSREQRRYSRAVTADGAIAMHDDADRDATAPPRGSEAGVAVHDRDEIAEAQRLQSITSACRLVEQLDVHISAPNAVLAEARTDDRCRQPVGYGRLQY